ncbi:MAG: DoxX family protein [Polyangiaceae bacterium]
MSRARPALRLLLAVSMMGVGVSHFLIPATFEAMVPASLPAHGLLVAVSGFFEILGGGGLLVPRARRAASLGLVLLYLSVFPANVNMLLHPEAWPGLPVWSLWARLPFQALFIAWALWAGKPDGKPVGDAGGKTELAPRRGAR